MPWFAETQTVADPLPVQSVAIRQGDRLSAFATVIEDEYGTPLDLADARAFLTLRALSPTLSAPMLDRVELTIEGDGSEGLVTYDWQASETMGARPGTYEVVIEIEYIAGANDGVVLSVPSSDQQAVVYLRSSLASDWFLTDSEGALIPDGAGGFELFDPLLLEDGTYMLLEDGSYLLLDNP